MDTVLFVDDDALIRAAYVELLVQEGYRVHEAKDGPAALAALDGIAGPCIVVLDEQLPGLSGSDVLAVLARRPDAGRFRVVRISGRSASGREAPSPVRVTGRVEKPFGATELLDAMARPAA